LYSLADLTHSQALDSIINLALNEMSCSSHALFKKKN